MKYIAYHRKSTDEPDNQLQSLDTQKRITDSIVKRDSLKVIEDYSEAISARIPNKRPLFARMIDQIKKAEADGIITAHLDRLTRNGTESAQIISLFELGLLKEIRTGSKIYNCSEDILYMDFDFAFSAHFSRQLSKKVKEGMETKRLKGEFPNRAPIGYKNKDGRIYPDPKYAPFIKRAYSLYLAGDHSLRTLTHYLNDIGFRTRDAGNKLSKSALHEILTNQTYYGVIPSHGKLYKGIHKPLITKEMFDMVQDRLNGRTQPRKHKHDFLYRGYLVCAVCECAMTASTKKGRFTYYYCTNGRHICDQHLRYLPEARVHSLLRQSLDSISLQGSFAELAFSTYTETIRRAAAAGSTYGLQTRKQISDVETKTERLLDLYLEKKIDSTTYESKKISLELEKQTLEDQLKTQKAQNPERTLELIKDMKNYACSLKELFDSEDYEVRVKLLKSVLWNLSIKDGEIASKQYKKPYLYLEDLNKTRNLETW